MKKFISFCLVITVVMGILNYGTIEALANGISEFKSLYSTISKSESADSQPDIEETGFIEKKDFQQEEINSLNENDLESEETNTLDDKEADYEKSNDSEDEESKIDEFEALKEEERINESRGKYDIKVTWDNSMGNYADSIKNAINTAISANAKNVTIRFDVAYTMTKDDEAALKNKLPFESITFYSSMSGAKLIVPSGINLTFNPDNISSPNLKSIKFESIHFEFKGANSNIAVNGIDLHMGTGIIMVGNNYPTLYGGSNTPDNNNNPINKKITINVKSGNYDEIYTSSIKGGRKISSSELNFHGGTVNRINGPESTMNYNTSVMYVKLYGGIVGEIRDNRDTNISNGLLYLSIYGKTEVTKIYNVTNTYIYNNGHLVLKGDLSHANPYESKSFFVMYGGTFEIGKDGKANVYRLDINSSATLSLPGNRGKNNIPLNIRGKVSDSDTTIYKGANLKLNTDFNATLDEFYLINSKYNANTLMSGLKITDDSIFYLDKLEATYIKGKKKANGPLIYDIALGKFKYNDSKGTEQLAWWINDKLSNQDKELTHDDLLKNENGYVFLNSDVFELQIKGTGSNRTLKFNNEKSSTKKFNVKFKGINATNSEFSFKNVESITIEGENIITQDADKTPLTYSLVSANNSNGITFTDSSSRFLLYRKDRDNNKYTIENTINYNGAVLGNNSIINMSFEDTPTSDKNMKLFEVNNSSNTKEIPIKSGYDILTVFSVGDNKEYLLHDENKTKPEESYYYQGAKPSGNQNSGSVGRKLTIQSGTTNNYYKVNNKPKVHVIVTQNSQKLYYISDTLKDVMEKYVAHTNGTHEVVFIGNYTITQEDVAAVKVHNGNTNGVTFKSEIDSFKYKVNVGVDIELKVDNNGTGYPVAFDKIIFNYTTADKWIYANGRSLTFGDNVEMEGTNYPSISAGQNSSGTGILKNANVTIKLGKYNQVTGDRYDTVENGNLTINNGTFNGTVDAANSIKSNITLTINNGTFNSNVIGLNGGTGGSVTLIINTGTFNSEVIGVNGGTATNVTVTINNGTFNSKVSGANTGSTVTGDSNLKIDGGTFKGVVAGINGGTVNSNSKLTITNGTFKNKVYGINSGGSLIGNFDFQIDNGTFENTVRGVDLDATRGIFKRFIFGNNMRGALNGTLNIKINNGTFSEQVQGISSGADNTTVNLEISGGNFNHNVVALGKSTRNGTTDMKITGGTYNAQVVGQYSDNSNFSAKSVTLNIEDGTFNNLIYGAVLSENTIINVNGGTFNSGSKLDGKFDRGGNSTININNNIAIPQIGNFDKLVVGENGKSTLTVKNKIVDGPNNGNNTFESELEIKNGSEVKLEGTDQSQVKKLKLDGSTGNTLTLAMDRATVPLMVKEDYQHGGNKLTLKALGQKANNKEFIEFSKIKADVNNFYFMDNDYYIREIDNNTGNKIKIYEKMAPNNITFKVDTARNTLKYSVNNGNEEAVWWYKPNLSNQDIKFLENDMFKYKGMELFKDMTKIASGDKVFEITAEGDSKNISIDLGVGKDFDLKLNNSKLNNSTLNAKNIKDLVLEGANSISELSGTKNPFDVNISGEVKSTNDKSHLSIFTNESNLPFSGSLVNGRRDVARVIDFKFREDFKNDENLRLVANGGGSELALTVPTGTGRLGVVFGKNNANQTYNLYYGANGNTGTSVYVSGDNDATFKKSFTTSSNDNVTAYDYVRRAKPVNKVATNITNQFSFSIDTQTSGLTGITPGNWNKYFNAKDVNITNNSIVAEDEFTDDQGVTYHFGKKNSDVELGYLGVSPSKTKKNDMQLVDSSALDSNITSIASGAKVALKLGIGQDVVPLDENNTQSTNPLKKWTIPASATNKLEIQPNFNSSDIFFNVSYNANSTLNSSHSILYRVELPGLVP